MLKLDLNDLAKRYRSGQPRNDIVRELGVSRYTVDMNLRKINIGPSGPTKRPDVPAEAVVRYFKSGESVKATADHFNIGRRAIVIRLMKLGVSPRGRSASIFLRMAKTTPQERKALTTAAHAAVRGRIVPVESKIKRALMNELNPKIYPLEERFAGLLKSRGVTITHQKAIGMYNCDIASYPVAVEVWGCNFPPNRCTTLMQLKRFKEFFRLGWHVVVVCDRPSPIGSGAADYIAAFIKSHRGKPSTVRQYRMISGAGKLLAGGNSKTDELPVEYPFTNRRNPTNGQYERIAKKAVRV